jgi:predicted Na+-dependent transporter
MTGFLRACERRGRALLVAGLVAGLAGGLVWPQGVARLAPLIGPVVVALLFLAVLRLGPEGVRAGLRGLGGAVAAVLVLQLALPLAVAGGFAALGWAGPVALGVVLTLAAAPVTGSPNLTLMAGGDGAAALRALVLGTALLPLTVVPVFLIVPAFGDPATVAGVVGRLLLMIGAAGGLALALRHWRVVETRHLPALDGVSALLLAAIVVALMGAAGPALLTPRGWGLLAGAFALNLGLNLTAAGLARARGQDSIAAGMIAGNRNIALFLGAIPTGVVPELLPWIGLYQIPMYLAPVLMPPLYRALGLSPTSAPPCRRQDAT